MKGYDLLLVRDIQTGELKYFQTDVAFSPITMCDIVRASGRPEAPFYEVLASCPIPDETDLDDTSKQLLEMIKKTKNPILTVVRHYQYKLVLPQGIDRDGEKDKWVMK